MKKSIHNTPSSGDAYVYEVALDSLERVRHYMWDKRKFMDLQTDRDYTIICLPFNGRIKSLKFLSYLNQQKPTPPPYLHKLLGKLYF